MYREKQISILLSELSESYDTLCYLQDAQCFDEISCECIVKEKEITYNAIKALERLQEEE